MAACPLAPAEASALFDHIARQLRYPVLERCDHTLRHTEDWCALEWFDWLSVREWLHSAGGFCDCEVLFNVAGDAAPVGEAVR